jgi:hypothetical protein
MISSTGTSDKMGHLLYHLLGFLVLLVIPVIPLLSHQSVLLTGHHREEAIWAVAHGVGHYRISSLLMDQQVAHVETVFDISLAADVVQQYGSGVYEGTVTESALLILI